MQEPTQPPISWQRLPQFLAATWLALAQVPCSAATRDVTSLGAKPDDQIDDSTAIQASIGV